MHFAKSLTVLALFAPAAIAQWVPPPTDLVSKMGSAGIKVRYKEVPTGISESTPGVKSYSGYADVGKNQHIFFWFIESREVDPAQAPLTAWLNGGPGSPSLLGLWQEVGPSGFDINGIYNNTYAWNQKSNMIFIDQPVTTGFSYTKPIHAWQDPDTYEIHPLNGTTCPPGKACGTFSDPDISLVPNSTAAAAPFFWKTLQGFMGAFPQYSQNGFNLATESYGGHYGPAFASYILEQNAALPPCAQKINLKALTIGNGIFDTVVTYDALYNFTTGGNTYDLVAFNKTMQQKLHDNIYGQGACLDQVRQCYSTGDPKTCLTATLFCGENVENFIMDVGGRDEYDIRERIPDPFPYQEAALYLNTQQVQSAIGAFTNATFYSVAVATAFGSSGDIDAARNTVTRLKKLAASGVYITLYHGDADVICNWLGGEQVASMIGAPGYKKAGYAPVSTPDGVRHGEVRQAGNFAFVRVYESGHEMPFYQPELALEMFNRVIQGLDIETGKRRARSGYTTSGPSRSTYREGNGTVQWEVVPVSATYNTTTGKPNLPPS